MVDILEPYKGRVYDPCCGSGGMFVQCSKFVKEHQGLVDDISIFGQESNPGTWKMAKMNLAIRGLEGNGGRHLKAILDGCLVVQTIKTVTMLGYH